MNFFTYVLKSEVAEKSYVGSTNDLDRRLSEHNNGKSIYTSRYKPWKLIYKEEFPTPEEARLREKYLKSKSGRKFLKNVVFKNNPSSQH
jgi:putative endonuclease